MLKGTVEDLLANRLEINVNVNTDARNIIITVERIDGVPTSYSYQILEPEEYKKEINNIDKNTYTFDKLKIDTEYKIKVIVKNKVGLTKEITKVVNTEKVDEIDLELSPKNEYIKEGTVTITYPNIEEGLVNKYKWNDEEEFTTVNENTITIPAKNGILTAVLMDGEEIITSNQITITNIDNVAPVIEKIEGNDNVQSNRKIIKISANDLGVGVIKYSCDDGTTWQDKNECIYNQNGKQKIKVKDSLENISESNEINITTIASEETFTINNLFSNGSFETDETIGFSTESIEKTEYTTSEHMSGKRSLKAIPIIKTTNQWGAGLSIKFNVVKDDIYYGTVYCKSRIVCGFGIYSSDWASGGIDLSHVDLISNSTWVKPSFYYKIPATKDINFRLNIGRPSSTYFDPAIDNGNPSYFDDIIFLDLTEIFGKGNEPTKEWCDENINYNTTTIKKYNNSVDIR